LEYGFDIQIVRGIYKNKDSLVYHVVLSSSPGGVVKRKVHKKSTFKELDASVVEWYKCQCSKGIIVIALA
jgi:hypothetical protein